MSQKKVDAYKERKANHEKINKREKRILMLEKLAVAAVCLAIVGWLGFSAYHKIADASEADTTNIELNTAGIDDYLNQLNSSTAE